MTGVSGGNAGGSAREGPTDAWVARLTGVSHRYRTRYALRDVDLELPAGRMVGLIGPDGVGKSSLLALVAGVREVQSGKVLVLGGDISREAHRESVCPRIAYMPQGLGKNLYPTLSVRENVDFFGRLFGLGRRERAERIALLLEGTGLAPFSERPAGKLSGGMKQKLGLCCALIHEPDFLILDEPTTGVDPLSRRQFWELIGAIRRDRPGMSVVVATAYMDEASRFDWLIAMDDGGVLDAGTPGDLLRRTGTGTLESAFIALLPEGKRLAHQEVKIPPRSQEAQGQVAIESRDLTMRFGDFVAVDKVSFRIERGEIFGFLGSNGCGKTTTMKMLTGLLPASEGQAWVFGEPVDAQDLANRRRIGYMSQGFSLYSELTVRQNLVLHARLFDVPAGEIPGRARGMAERFGLTGVLDELPESLPLGQRQRLSLAVALIHQPELLILDEPTSGVDPIARDAFWQFLVELSREDHVTIFISTHFVDEAQRCDRISLMHAGKVLVCDSPGALIEKRGAASLEDAFIGYLEEAAEQEPAPVEFPARVQGGGNGKAAAAEDGGFSLGRLLSFSYREALELSRDPVRLTLALLGSVILLMVNGFGISFDVEKLTFAVLDRDQTTISRDYHMNLAGSRYFLERPPLTSYQEMDRRMISGDTSLVVEIPPDFGRKLERGSRVELGVWVDGSMPQRGETIEGYVAGMHAQWLARRIRETRGEDPPPEPARVETRFLYNPGIKSIVAMVPAVIPLLLILIPAMLTALAVVREKEMGSIVNLYVTPVNRVEFLVGKQLPYILLGFLNYLVLAGQAAFFFGIPFKGSFAAQTLGALLYVASSTAFGLLISTFMRSQIAAIFGTAFLTVLPAVQFSGMLDPVSSLEGPGALIGAIHPTAYFLIISRGTFSKGLGFGDLAYAYAPLALAIPILTGLSISLLRKQEA